MSGQIITRRHCRALRTATLFCVVPLLTHSAFAQSDVPGVISWHATIVGGSYLGMPPRAYQAYREEMAEVEISVSLSNRGQDTLYFNSGMIERAMRFRLFFVDEATGDRQESAVRVTTRGVLNQDGAGPSMTVPDQLLQADARGGMVVWIVAATLPDGRPFTPGRYRFEIELRDVRPAIVTAAGEPLPPNWVMGQWQSGVTRGDLELVIHAPSTPGEVAAMYVQRGEVAFERRQFDEAMMLFMRAVDADPSDTALHRLGGTYLAMDRYAEAVSVLERLQRRGPGPLEAALVLAYVGVGNDAEAVNLLRRNGWPEADVAARIERLRETVRQRPGR